MRIVFAGTPEFAAVALAAILDAAPARGWTVPLVLTQPDRPSGRGMKLRPSAVKLLAVERGIALELPASLRKGDDAERARLRLAATAPDVLVVAAYGLILPESILAIPRAYGAINIHASLLPRWRGAAPVARAIEAGDRATGITIMKMDTGLDTGAMLLAESIAVAADATTATLTHQLADLGARLIVRALTEIETLAAQEQPAAGTTYASKLMKTEAWLDWTAPADLLARRVRAFDPFPVASAWLGGQPIRLWRARSMPQAPAAPPGTIVVADAQGVLVSCGEGHLLVEELQRPGGKRLSAREFVVGMPGLAGQQFERPNSVEHE